MFNMSQWLVVRMRNLQRSANAAHQEKSAMIHQFSMIMRIMCFCERTSNPDCFDFLLVGEGPKVEEVSTVLVTKP